MSTQAVGQQLADLCRQGRNLEAIETLYADHAVSIEVAGHGDMPRVTEGKAAILGKNQWWLDNHEVHGGDVKGPFPHEDRVALYMSFDITPKHLGQRIQIEEVGLYTVEGDKIVKEEFFYGDM